MSDEIISDEDVIAVEPQADGPDVTTPNKDTGAAEAEAPIKPRYIAVIFNEGSLGIETFREIRRQLRRAAVHGIAGAEVDVWLESPGGSASAAYKIALEFRSYFSVVRVVVPEYAKSAATLLAISADEIVMASSAELGPLDVQIEHPDRENVTISGLDESRALGFLADFAANYIVQGGFRVYHATELSRRDVLREFSTFTAHLLQPLVAKLDPQLWHRAAQDLDLGARYAVAMLFMRNLSPEVEALQSEPRTLVHHLVEHYPAHEFLISRDEARHNLCLPITNLENYDKMEQLYRLHEAFQEGRMECSSYIAVFHESECDDMIDRVTGEGCDEDEEDDEDDYENDENE